MHHHHGLKSFRFPRYTPPGIFWYVPVKKGGLIASLLHNEETQDFGSTVLGLLQPNFLEFQFALFKHAEGGKRASYTLAIRPKSQGLRKPCKIVPGDGLIPLFWPFPVGPVDPIFPAQYGPGLLDVLFPCRPSARGVPSRVLFCSLILSPSGEFL